MAMRGCLYKSSNHLTPAPGGGGIRRRLEPDRRVPAATPQERPGGAFFHSCCGPDGAVRGCSGEGIDPGRFVFRRRIRTIFCGP